MVNMGVRMRGAGEGVDGPPYSYDDSWSCEVEPGLMAHVRRRVDGRSFDVDFVDAPAWMPAGMGFSVSDPEHVSHESINEEIRRDVRVWRREWEETGRLWS